MQAASSSTYRNPCFSQQLDCETEAEASTMVGGGIDGV